MPDATFWTRAVDLVPFTAVVLVILAIVVGVFLRAINSTVGRFLTHLEMRDKRQERLTAEHRVALDRNTDALGKVWALVSEIEELRGDGERHHRDYLHAHSEMRHAVRDLANAAGLEKHWEEIQRQQAHRASGGPPGTVMIETPPATLRSAEEERGKT